MGICCPKRSVSSRCVLRFVCSRWTPSRLQMVIPSYQPKLVPTDDEAELSSDRERSSPAAPGTNMGSPSSFIREHLPPACHRIGLVVATNPCRTIGLVLLVASFLLFGVTLTDLDNNYDNWYPHQSQAYSDYEYLQDKFGSSSRSEMFLVEAHPSPAVPHGVLTKSTLLASFQLHDAIFLDPGMQSICTKQVAGASCSPPSSIFLLWGNDISLLSGQTQEQILATVDANALGLPLGVFLGDFAPSPVTAASAIQVVFSVHDDPQKEASITTFEADFFLPTCRSGAADFQTLNLGKIFCQAELSYSAESDRAIAGDQILMSFAMILMIAYVAVVLSRRDLVESKVLLGLTIVACVGLSLGVAFGVCGYAGIPFTQVRARE